jgi:hypothetical protein
LARSGADPPGLPAGVAAIRTGRSSWPDASPSAPQQSIPNPSSWGARPGVKQVLPIGSLNYDGRKLNFTTAYIQNLVQSFKDRLDAVPLQLADVDNRHTNHHERSVGEVISLEATDDGLYAPSRLRSRLRAGCESAHCRALRARHRAIEPRQARPRIDDDGPASSVLDLGGGKHVHGDGERTMDAGQHAIPLFGVHPAGQKAQTGRPQTPKALQ